MVSVWLAKVCTNSLGVAPKSSSMASHREHTICVSFLIKPCKDSIKSKINSYKKNNPVPAQPGRDYK